MDRRNFLKALIGLGAAVALPLRPTDEQVDEAWDQLVQRPFVFKVDEYGTIAEPEGPPPKTNHDIYRIDVAELTSTKALIDTVRSFPELESHFGALAESEREDAENQLARATLSRAERKALEHVVEVLGYPTSDWIDWIRAEGKKGVPQFVEKIASWLDEPVNWNAMEQWPRGWFGQGKALRFFQMLNRYDRDALGVVIVEGDCPGSSYFAAELRQPIAEANATTTMLELPFRFTASG